MTRRRRSARLALTAAATGVLVAAALLVPLSVPVASAAPRPNIILITADDMARSDLRRMPATRRLLQDAGVTVNDFISNHPLCCPARAEILTGQYGHNNGVRYNTGRFGGYLSLRGRNNHVGTWLQSTGYRTALIGKGLNRWERTLHHQGGWTTFDPILRRIYWPTDLTMFNNGSPRRYPGEYTADLISRLTVSSINRFSASGAPFFIWTAPVPPHNMFAPGRTRMGPPVPAPRHASLYPNAMPPSLSQPSFNEGNVSDKPQYVRQSPMVSRQRVIALHRARIRSLRAVDDQVRATVDALRATGELSQTYIFFTSDNGYQLGQHRQIGKNEPYEASLRVPLVVRGPGLPRGVVRPAMYSLVDLAPTFAALAGARPGRQVDGRSMVPTLRGGARGYSHYLIQASQGEVRPWWWRGVRSRAYVYVRYHSGFEELYDMSRDPAQLRNVARDGAYQRVRRNYAARLNVLSTCAGASCRTGGVP